MKAKHLLALVILTLGLSGQLAAAGLPGDSLYQLELPLTDASGHDFQLSQFAGQPLTLAMFYGNCHSACPLVLQGLKRSVAALPRHSRARLHILLLSLDAEHDTAESLSMLQQSLQLDRANFTLAVAHDQTATRTLGAALGIKYRRLENGEINHSTRVVVLDAEGRELGASPRISTGADPQLLALWRKALSK
jgi:protein SCO1/2